MRILHLDEVPVNAKSIPMFYLYDASIRRLVDIALQEDIGMGDLTTEAIVPPGQKAKATIIAKQKGVLCGLPIAQLVFQRLGQLDVWEALVEEGKNVKPQQPIVRMEGDAQLILTGERTALNFLQRMSGVATLTRKFVEAIRGTKATILDTRKTIPGWRLLDKYATKIGGAENHRMRLDDMILIKENHIAIAGSIQEAVHRVQAYKKRYNVPVVVEVQNLRQLREALSLDGIDRILLDNFSPARAARAVEITQERIPLEISGGITLQNVRAYAETGVQFISIGEITHSAPALDLSLLVEF